MLVVETSPHPANDFSFFLERQRSQIMRVWCWSTLPRFDSHFRHSVSSLLGSLIKQFHISALLLYKNKKNYLESNFLHCNWETSSPVFIVYTINTISIQNLVASLCWVYEKPDAGLTPSLLVSDASSKIPLSSKRINLPPVLFVSEPE